MNYPYAHLDLQTEEDKLEALSGYTSDKGYKMWNTQRERVENMKTHKEGRPYIPVGTKVLMTDGRLRMNNTATFVRHSEIEGHAILSTNFITNSWAYPKGNHFPYEDFRLSEFKNTEIKQRGVSFRQKQSFLELRGE